MKARWQIGVAVVAAVASLATLGSFTSPPIGSPNDGARSMWQAYSSLVERVEASCLPTYSNPPSSSGNSWTLSQYKTKLREVVNSKYWINPTNAFTNFPYQLTDIRILQDAGVTSTWWNDNSSSMLTKDLQIWTQVVALIQCDAIQGSIGSYDTYTNMILLAPELPYDPDSYVYYTALRTFCLTESNEAGLYFSQTDDESHLAQYPIGEARRYWWTSTNSIKAYRERQFVFAWTNIDCDIGSELCTNNPTPENPSGADYTESATTNYYCDYYATTQGWYNCAGSDCIDGKHNQFVQYYRFELMYEIQPGCAYTNTAPCWSKEFDVWSHPASVIFNICTNAIPFDAEEWYLGAVPDWIAHDSPIYTNWPAMTWDNQSGVSALTTNWAKCFTTASTAIIGDAIYRTDFWHERIPWQGEDANVLKGWSIADSIMIRRFAFKY